MDFVWLSKSPYPLFLMVNVKLDWKPTKIKWKQHAWFTLYFKFWEGTSLKSYKIQLPVSLFHFVLYRQISFLQLCRTLSNIIWKTIHVTNILFGMDSAPPSPLTPTLMAKVN